jgi:hypothetical protein
LADGVARDNPTDGLVASANPVAEKRDKRKHNAKARHADQNDEKENEH